MEKIILAYCRDNTDLAESVDEQLGRVGIPFEHVTNRPGALPGQFAAWVQSTSAPVILFVTDNFLKNQNCMASSLTMLQSLVRHNRLLTVVADGWQKTGGTSMLGTAVSTKFDRVADAIQYLNYWQNTYLQLENEEQTDTTDYRVAKEISNQIPDVLNALRDHGYMSYVDFSENDFELFFKKFGIIEWHDQYQKMAAVMDTGATAAPESSTTHLVTLEAPEETPTPQENIEEQSNSTGVLEEVPPTRKVIISNGVHAASTPQDEVHFGEMDALIEEIVEEEKSGKAEDDIIEESIADVFEETESNETPIPIQKPEIVQKESIVEQIATQKTPQQQTVHSPEKVLEDARQDAEYWFEKGEVEKGLRVLSVAVELNESNVPLRLEYAKSLIEKGHKENDAQIQLDYLLQDGIMDSKLYELLGDVAYQKEDYVLAKQYWDKVSQLDEGHPTIFVKLADLSANHFRGFQQSASDYYEKAIVNNPDNAETHYKHGALLLEHLNKPKKAARFLLQALNIDASNARAWSDLAIAYHHLGDYERSDAAYKKAIHLNADLQTETGDALFLLPSLEEIPTQKKEQLTVLITGATSGIGRATAELFCQHGHRVILTGRRTERLVSLKEKFSEQYTDAECFTLNFDVRDRSTASTVLHSLPEEWRTIDVLLNNAGLAKGLDPIHEGSFEHWDTMIDTNIKGLLNVTRTVAPWMVARRKGHIINVGSSAGKEAYGKGAVYCATKFGVDALTKAMRIDLHTYNIRVSQVSPGHVEETEFAVTRFDGDAEKAKIYEDFQPLRSSDVAEAIYFMATRPPHVNVQDIYMFGTQQANATTINRSGRE